MKCPLLGTMGTGDKIKPEWADCLREKCAWWSASLKSCAVLKAAVELASLVAIGNEIAQKMPSERHFGR